jgi:menaquinone-dependent protoporphyrinogen IX oxidase
MAGVTSLEGYSGLVMGSPINGMRIVPEALEFSRTHAAAISKRKCAVFAVSYMHEIARARWKNAIYKSVASWKTGTGAVVSAVFGGRVESLPGIMHLMFGIPKGSPKDTRKPGEVDAWAKYLVTVFLS